jgi:arylsulfatase
MRASISDDDADVAGPGGFTGVLQQYAYGRLYNLWLDPKETHSYMTRKLAYIELIVGAFARHLRTFRDFASRPRPRRA